MLTRCVPIVLCILAAGCGALRPGLEAPTVTLTTFRMLPSSGAVPSFEIGLNVVNPNRVALDLEGISYTVRLEGHEIVKGVSNRLPRIEAYGDGDITLTGTANLVAGIGLVAELMRDSRDAVDYELEAKLDLGGLRPPISITESGSVSLSGTTRR